MMEQPERQKTKYTKPYTSSWTNGYQTRSRETPESAWKYVQRNPLTVSSNRANRQHKHHTCTSVTHPKYTTALVQSTDMPHRYSHNNSRAIKERSLGNNVALMRGGRYKDEIDDQSPKYIDDELGNFTEDNADEDAAEEVEDEEEEAADDPEKEYEEPEASDEVDDDTEISPQLQRMQRRVKNEALLRAQRMRDAERQQDLRRLRYQSHPSKLFEDRPSSKRYYHNIPESDTAEPASEEEQVEPPVALKNTNRRSSMMGRHHTLHTWPQTRNTGRSEMTRYDASMQPSRRVRAWQDGEHLPEPRIDIGTTKKCSRCGGSDRKTSSSRKTICRLQNHRDFPAKGQVGDEIEPNEDTVCGRCNTRHGSEKTSGSCEFSRSGLYSLEPRRSRDTRAARSAVYETPEEVRAVDEVSEDYPTAKTRHCRENPALYRQTTKHSLQHPRDRTRTPSEYRV